MTCARSSAYIALTVIVFMAVAGEGRADSAALEAEVRKGAAAVEGKLIAWRRDIHQHPELGDQEMRTSHLVAEHLRGLESGGPHGRGAHGRRRHPEGRKAGSHRRPARRHGRASGRGAGGAALRVQSRRRQSRREGGPRHARLRARRAYGDAHGDRGGAGGLEGRPAGHGGVHLPARGGGLEPGRSIRWPELGRQADAGGGSVRGDEARRRLRPARHARTLGTRSPTASGADHGEQRHPGVDRHREAGTRRHAVEHGGPDHDVGARHLGPADRGEPEGQPHGLARGRHHRDHQRRDGPQHRARDGADDRHHPDV